MSFHISNSATRMHHRLEDTKKTKEEQKNMNSGRNKKKHDRSIYILYVCVCRKNRKEEKIQRRVKGRK